MGDARRPRHNHMNSVWILAGHWLWCYRCGAIRRLDLSDRWTRPTGERGENPALVERRKQTQERER